MHEKHEENKQNPLILDPNIMKKLDEAGLLMHNLQQNDQICLNIIRSIKFDKNKENLANYKKQANASHSQLNAVKFELLANEDIFNQNLDDPLDIDSNFPNLSPAVQSNEASIEIDMNEHNNPVAQLNGVANIQPNEANIVNDLNQYNNEVAQFNVVDDNKENNVQNAPASGVVDSNDSMIQNKLIQTMAELDQLKQQMNDAIRTKDINLCEIARLHALKHNEVDSLTQQLINSMRHENSDPLNNVHVPAHMVVDMMMNEQNNNVQHQNVNNNQCAGANNVHDEIINRLSKLVYKYVKSEKITDLMSISRNEINATKSNLPSGVCICYFHLFFV